MGRIAGSKCPASKGHLTPFRSIFITYCDYRATKNDSSRGDPMPAPPNNRTATSSTPSTAGSPDGGHGRLGHGWRLRSGTASRGRPDAAVLAREAVISFLNDASRATADRAGGILAAAPGQAPGTVPGGAVAAAGQVAAAQATGSAGWGGG